MSLATDILKRAERVPPPKPIKKPRAPGGAPAVRKKPEKKKAKRKYKQRQHKAPEHAHIPGVSFDRRSGGWAAYYYDGVTRHRVGLFARQDRAHIALRLFKFWLKRGFPDVPTKPTRRLYTNW